MASDNDNKQTCKQHICLSQSITYVTTNQGKVFNLLGVVCGGQCS